MSVPNEQRPPSAAGASPQTKLSRWFGLHIPDSDLFKEELRFWRSITSLLGLETISSGSSNSNWASPSSTIPDLVLDVMLDLSNVPNHHEVLLLTNHNAANSPNSKHPASPPHASASSSRICIDGRRPGDAPSSRTHTRPQRIVLERWRLRFDHVTPSTPPDLSTFYKRSVIHFRALFTLLCSLPSNSLCAKLEALKASPERRGSQQASQPPFPSLSARDDISSCDREMTIGCRLSLSMPEEPSDPDAGMAGLEEEVGVTETLTAEQGLSFEDAEGAVNMSTGKRSGSTHYAIRSLAPITTPIGLLELSVTYRKLTGFSVEDAESLRSAQGIKVDLDEDYFRAAATQTSVSVSQPQSRDPKAHAAESRPTRNDGTFHSFQHRLSSVSAASRLEGLPHWQRNAVSKTYPWRLLQPAPLPV